MFKKKQDLQSSKPYPPFWLHFSLVGLHFLIVWQFSFTVSTLKSINENLRQDETNQGVPLSEIPIYQPPR